MQILFITSEWPTETQPYDVPFLVEYVHALEKEGIKVDVFHFKGKSNPLNYLKAWREIRRLPYWQHADILHAHWGQSALIGIFTKKPLVITFHGSDLQGIVNKQGKYSLWGKLLVMLSKWIAKQADQVIVVSDRLRKFLPANLSGVSVIPMGIDLSLFKPEDQLKCRLNLGLDPNKKYVLFASDPDRPEKRYYLANQAVQRLLTPGNKSRVELSVVYNQPHHKIPAYLNAADVLLLTSAHEGSPLIIKEALACNLPIVSVDVGDVKERIESVDGCYLCPDDRVETIAHNLIKAIKSSHRINGVTSVQNFAWELIAKQTLSIYKECLK